MVYTRSPKTTVTNFFGLGLKKQPCSLESLQNHPLVGCYLGKGGEDETLSLFSTITISNLRLPTCSRMKLPNNARNQKSINFS